MARVVFITVNDRCCLGAKQLSSLLKTQGHAPYIVHYGEYVHATYESTAFPGDPPSEQAVLGVLEKLNPDLIGFSFRSVSFSVVKHLSQLIKARMPNTPLVAGGIGATSDPEACIPFSDAVCIGEGEDALTEMLRRIDAGARGLAVLDGVCNLWVKVGGAIQKNPIAPLIDNLDSLPFSDYTAENKITVVKGQVIDPDARFDNNVGAYSLITSRGCPFRCTYCHNSLVHDLYKGQKYLQRRSVDHVMRELIAAKAQFPQMQSVNFYDDLFTFDYNWVKEFVGPYTQHIKLPFWCFIHPSRVDERIIELLANANCRFFCLGVQSGSERTLFDVFHRRTPLKLLHQDFAKLRRQEARVQVDLITANPFETDEDRRETLRMVCEMDKRDDPADPLRWNLSMSRLTYFPHAEITRRAQEQGIDIVNRDPALDRSADFWEMLNELAMNRCLGVTNEEIMDLSNREPEFRAEFDKCSIENAARFIFAHRLGGAARRPVVIGIVTWNRKDLLQKSIEAVQANTFVNHRICVVDNASTDGTREYLQSLGDQVDVIWNNENLGFVVPNNQVFRAYPGHDVVMLNNDTQVKRGWLNALQDTAYSAPNVGVVCPKLLFPDGRLQEAGGEIFRDASGRNIGKYDDARRHQYNQVREVDYGSGACLYVKREVIEKTGGLDEQFAPAYWEDTDLCFAARKAGYRVLYQPQAEVVHFEGGTAGKAEKNSRSQQLQERNKPRFVAKWADALATKRENMYDHRPTDGRPQLLCILPFLPIHDRAAGEFRWFQTLKLLKDRYNIVYVARNGENQLAYVNELEEMGITVYATDYERMARLGHRPRVPFALDLPSLLKTNNFETVIIGFFHVAHQYLDLVRVHSPQSTVICDSFDLHFLREKRLAQLSGASSELWKAAETRRRELTMYRRCDIVTTVTEKDREVLLDAAPDLRVGIFTDIHPLKECPARDKRRGLVFIGNYNHPPNADAVKWFCAEVMPLLRQRIKDLRFYIVGNEPSEDVKALACKDVIVTGFVPSIDPYLQQSMVCVVPLRYGAGLKGKVGQAMAAGIPMVATTIAAEGMPLTNESSVLIADTPQAFAEAVVRLHDDAELWNRLSEQSRRLADRHYGFDNAARLWDGIFNMAAEVRRLRQAGQPLSNPVRVDKGYKLLPARPTIAPNLSIVIPCFNGRALTEQCVASIRRHTTVPYEIIIVDNGSADGTAHWADQDNIRWIRNDKNLGFAVACNQGIMNSYGDYVVLLNNDTLVTPHWAERLIAHVEADSRIGIVSPSTNYANNVQRIEVCPYEDDQGMAAFSESVYRRNAGKCRDLPYVVGFCMLLTRPMIEHTGLFDPRFGLGNFEDNDLCRRAQMAGFRTVWAEDVFIHHHGSQCFKQNKIDYRPLIQRNLEFYKRKWAGVNTADESLEAENRADAMDTAGGCEALIVVDLDGDTTNLRETSQALVESAPPGARFAFIGRAPKPEVAAQIAGISNGELFDRRHHSFAAVVNELLDRYVPRHVCVLSPDVLVTRKWYERLVEAMRDKPSVIAAGPVTNVSDNGQGVRAGYTGSGRGLREHVQKVYNKERLHTARAASLEPFCAVFKAQALRKAGGLPIAFDTIECVRLAARSTQDREAVVATGVFVHRCVEHPAKAHPSDKTRATEAAAVRDLNTAEALLASSKPAEAAAAARRVVSAYPGMIEALLVLSGACRQIGQMDKAILHLEKASSLRPADTNLANELGCLHFAAGNLDKAEALFHDVMRKTEGNTSAMMNLGEVYLAANKLKQAGVCAQGVLKTEPSSVDARMLLAKIFITAGGLDQAMEACQQVLSLSPKHSEASQMLKAITEHLGAQASPAQP